MMILTKENFCCMQVPPRKPDGMLIGYLLHKDKLSDESPVVHAVKSGDCCCCDLLVPSRQMVKYRSKASSLMGPEVKHTRRQHEHMVPAAQRSEQNKGGIVVQIRETKALSYLYAEVPCSLSKLDLGLCWFDDLLKTVLPRLFSLFEFSASVS